MSSIFNLGKHLGNIFAKKSKKGDGEQIETKLTEQNSDSKEPEELTEGLLQKDRKDTTEETIEKKLEKVRTGSTESLVEKQLDSSKSSIVQHRNAEAATGKINKLEEKRLKNKDLPEKSKYEPASEVEKARRFWNVKSPDGLKLASSKKHIKLADLDDFDIDLPDFPEDKFEDVDKKFSKDPLSVLRDETFADTAELSPGAIAELEGLKESDKKLSEETISDPEFLNSWFSEEVVGTSNETGTNIEQRVISFDLGDDTGDIIGVFKQGNNINEAKIKEAIMFFLDLNHPKENITEDAVSLDIDVGGLSGSATYMVATPKTRRVKKI